MGEPETLPGPEPQADNTPPTNPANLTATAVGVGRIDLAWTASTDNISVAGYNVERCSGAGCSNFAQIGTPLANSYSDTGLTGHTSYSYRVRAKDTAGNLSLGYSNVVTLALPDQVAPAAPKSLSVVIGGVGVLNLSWIASTDDVGVANYSVERCTGPSCSDFVQIGTSTTASYSDTGLLDSTSYSYRVMAADAAGNHSAYSNVATGNVGDQLAPTAPSNLKATPVNVDQIDLAWNAASDNIGVINYHVERSSGTTGAPFDQVGTTGGGTHFSSTGLTTHRYRVRAEDAAGNLGPYSEIVSANNAVPPSGPASPSTFAWQNDMSTCPKDRVVAMFCPGASGATHNMLLGIWNARLQIWELAPYGTRQPTTLFPTMWADLPAPPVVIG